MAKKKLYHTKKIIAAVVGITVLVVGLTLGYKSLERKTLAELEYTNNEFIANELSSIEKLINSGKEVTREYREDYEKNKLATAPKNIDEYVELQKDIFDRFEKNMVTRFSERKLAAATLADHQSKYKTFESNRLRYFSSQSSKLARALTSSRQSFYAKELEDIDRNEVTAQYMVNAYELRKDDMVLGSFMGKMRSMNETQLSNSFSSISGLEKYSRDDFAFRDGEKIKSLFPYSYESLEKQRKVLKSSYLAIKDLVSGNVESAAYKFSRLRQDMTDVSSIDQERLSKDGQTQSLAIKQSLVESLLGSIRSTRDLGWQTDLPACYLYLYKIDQYQIVNDKYPNVQSFIDLRQELSGLTPDTADIDEQINPDKFIYSTTDKDITFTCKLDDKTYTFSYFKSIDQQNDEKKK